MINWYLIYSFELDGPEPQKLYTVRTVEVEGKRFCLGRLPDGYFAVEDKCPHAQGRLGLGKCNEDGEVICPVHRYKYDLKTGKGAPEQGDSVGTLPVETRDDGVYIGFEKLGWKLFPWW
jgi:3-phenylpropionate/trans-cinnamate dioxygenase ferredoxin subunit